MFEINSPQLDFLTVTTWDAEIMGVLYNWHKSIGTERESKRMQYVGTTTSDRYGTSFNGTAEQRNRTHMLCTVSGSLAESLFTRIRPLLPGGRINVTRIDLQVTIEYDPGIWNQFHLFTTIQRLRPNWSSCYFESQSGPQGTKLSTVYIGSRKSERMIRIYEKLGLADAVYLRLEVEYKGERAKKAAEMINEDAPAIIIRRLLMGEVERMNIPQVSLEFTKYLLSIPLEPKVVPAVSNTELWLRETVAPSLDRFLNQHGANGEAIARLYEQILSDYLDKLESGGYN